MTQRENAERVLKNKGKPQWVPLTADCFTTIFPSGLTEKAPMFQSGLDGFGCPWVWDAQCFGHAPNVKLPPVLEDVCQWREKVHFPDLDAVDWEAIAKRDLEGVDRETKLVRMFCEMGPFERTNTLLGFENAFIAMMEEPEEYKALLDACADYKVRVLNKLLPLYQPDEVFFHDDLGTANGPMISLNTYRELVKPAHKRIAETIHSHGALYTHHSCGWMDAFLDELVDNGIDGINPLQAMNDWKAIAEKYSDRLYFNVGFEIHANVPDTAPEQLWADVHEIIDLFGERVIADVFISNVDCRHNGEILMDEIRTYGAQAMKG